MNLLESDNLEAFKEQRHVPVLNFSKLISFTNTIEGQITGIKFMESDLIKCVEPDDDIVVFRCNYGSKINPAVLEWYNAIQAKKKQKKPSDRKVQGAGTDFNSQMTCFMRSRYTSINSGNDLVVYKFKVFRTGRIQLPGVHPRNIDDVIDCGNLLAAKFATVMEMYYAQYPEQIPSPLESCKMTFIRTIMQNSKFFVNISAREQINLYRLYYTIANCRDVVAGFEPRFVSSNAPSRENVALSVLFITNPDIGKIKNKKNHVNIFARGKINILGANSAEIAAQIYQYFGEILFNPGKYLAHTPVDTNNFNIIYVKDMPPPLDFTEYAVREVKWGHSAESSNYASASNT